MLRDIRYALRSLARRPGFAAAAAATLALAIGANAAIFSAVQATLLRPLPYPDPERLVMVWEVNPREQTNVVNAGNFLAWSERSTRIEAMAGYAIAQQTFGHGGRTERVRFGLATDRLFEMLGVPAVRGRAFEPGDSTRESGNPILLSEGFWRRRFGGDPGVIGTSAAIDGRPATIVGVVPRLTLPRSIDASTDTEVWAAVPLDERARTHRGRWMTVVGRLAAGATVAEARAEVRSLAAQLERERPEFNGGWSATVEPFHSDLVRDVRGVLVALMGAVGVLLLIACVNVAGLMLAQALAREREIAVRAAIGAGTGRLVRQLLAESLVLAALGAGLGLLLGTWLLQALLALLPAELPLVGGARLDAGVLAFTAGVALAAALLFGLLPAVRAARVPIVGALKEGTAAAGTGRRRSRLRDALVVAEVALALVLLVGAGLVVRSFERLSDVDPGFRPAGALSFAVSLPSSDYGEPGEATRYFDEALERLGAVPGVESAGAISWRPLGTGAATSFRALDRPAPEPGKAPVAAVRIVAGDLFDALGVPLLRGRLFETSDARGAPPVVVVNRILAEELWPAEEAVGRRLAMSWGDEVEAEVVGVVGDVRLGSLDAAPRPTLYWPQAQLPSDQMTFIVRSALPFSQVAGPVRAAVARIDDGVPVAPPESLTDVVSASLGAPRFLLVLLGVFAAAAALLAAVGLYGVVAFGVEQRRAEIGVRLALGADAGRLRALVLRDGLALAGLGILLGLPAAFAASRLLEAQLFEVGTADPIAYAAVSLLLVAIAGAATLVPARRATRVDPLDALRAE